MALQLPSQIKSLIVPKKNPGLGFAFGGAMIMLVLTASESVYPNYSIHTDAISYLGGAGVATEWFWNTALFIAALLWIWSSAGIFYGRHRFPGSPIFYATGLGMALVALSPWDVRPATHTIGALATLLFGIGSCYIGGRMVSGPMKYLSYAAATLSLIAFLSGFFGLFAFLGPGGLERMDYFPLFLWETAFGGYFLGRHASAGSETALKVD